MLSQKKFNPNNNQHECNGIKKSWRQKKDDEPRP